MQGFILTEKWAIAAGCISSIICAALLGWPAVDVFVYASALAASALAIRISMSGNQKAAHDMVEDEGLGEKGHRDIKKLTVGSLIAALIHVGAALSLGVANTLDLG